MYAIDVVDGDRRHHLVLRRWARTDLPPRSRRRGNGGRGSHAACVVRCVPVPRLVAADLAAEHTDAPTLVMARLDGNDTLDPIDVDAWVGVTP